MDSRHRCWRRLSSSDARLELDRPDHADLETEVGYGGTHSRATESCRTRTLHIVLDEIHKGANVASFIV